MAEKKAIPDPYLRLPAPAQLDGEALAGLRRREAERCVVFAHWSALEPREGQFDDAALESLRASLVAVGALRCEPVLCLYRDRSPAWFTERGGWQNEDNLRSYLRYAGRLTRALGHLAAEYITFYEPNALAWAEAGPGRVRRAFRAVSNMAGAHVRAFRLIRDTRQQRQLGDTAVGFVLRMYPELDLRRGLLKGANPATASGYQRMPLLAMGKGEFIPPMHNGLRIRPGDWADFVGVTGAEGEKRLICCREVEDFSGIPARVMEE